MTGSPDPRTRHRPRSGGGGEQMIHLGSRIGNHGNTTCPAACSEPYPWRCPIPIDVALTELVVDPPRSDDMSGRRGAEVSNVLDRIGTAGLRWAVEFDALVIVAPDYIVTPEGVELGPFMTEWTSTLGTADVDGSRFTVYWLSDDVAEWALESLTGRRQ